MPTMKINWDRLIKIGEKHYNANEPDVSKMLGVAAYSVPPTPKNLYKPANWKAENWLWYCRETENG
jgi:hypothetical protein